MDGAFSGSDGDADAFLARLVSEIAGLGVGRALTIVEFSPGHANVWEVRLDRSGTPRVRYWTKPWTDLSDASELSRQELHDFIQPEDPSRLMFVRSGDGGYDSYDGLAVDLARPQFRAAPLYRCDEAADDLIGAATASVPLVQWYELAVLRRTVSGRLIPTGQLLFPPGARRGDHPRQFTIQCEQADDQGTVFAVLARDDDEDPPAYGLVSLESARLTPGAHDVTATLVRPGKVRFRVDGLAGLTSPDPRTWFEILAAVPERLPPSAPVHLITVVELCGPERLFLQRIDCAERLVETIAAEARGTVSYSLAGYASHAFARMETDIPVEVLSWAGSAHAMLGALGHLGSQGALSDGSQHAAKLECALHQVSVRLAGSGAQAARPVVVTIGSRPPFPAKQEHISEILPCPNRKDWRQDLRQLSDKYPGIAFGAIHDGYPEVEAWKHLGSDARSRPDAFDVRQFTVNLGLLSPTTQFVPLPLTEQRG